MNISKIIKTTILVFAIILVLFSSKINKSNTHDIYAYVCNVHDMHAYNNYNNYNNYNIIYNTEYIKCNTNNINTINNTSNTKQKEYTKELWLKETNNSGFKPYEDYRCITDISSDSYKFLHQNNIRINEEGLMVMDDEWYCVALGSYFGKIGDRFIFTLDSRKQMKVVIGDMKQENHTCEDNYLGANGHIIEFILDTSSEYLESQGVFYNGSVGVLEKFKGEIVKIEKVI